MRGLIKGSFIHDVGKIGIPDEILLKPDHLTSHERAVIEQHPVIAVRILEKMSFLEKEIAIVRHHHERWNGQGYPDGLARTTIPLGARILAVADTFDALTASRAYHTARSVAEAMEILEDSAGYELDPTAVGAMATWIETVAGRLGTPRDRLAADDLLATYQPANRVLESAAALAPEPAAP
jgi:HD-GYP domain-containing protein (c-di-GMP phosphodiesterase class II)